MLLAESSLVEFQSDHQHWLREIERWEGCLDLWENEQTLLEREISRLQDAIQNHGSELRAHIEALKTLKAEIASSEREMIVRKGTAVDRSLAEAHSKIERNHAAQRDLHERFKRIHHTLMERLDLCED
ncbi:MAG: hypothetical protein HY290_13420 [Planctomycetia bacterium]|nr:hypothetical protein [Planctomycetia bacterium]